MIGKILKLGWQAFLLGDAIATSVRKHRRERRERKAQPWPNAPRVRLVHPDPASRVMVRRPPGWSKEDEPPVTPKKSG